MTASADVADKALIDIFDAVPEYDAYGDPDGMRIGEDTYRYALARLTKTWGEQLLELAEAPPTPLTGRDLHTIDALVERVTVVLGQLKDLDRARVLRDGGGRCEALLEADAAILKALEETSRLMQDLGGLRSPNLWLKHNAAPVYRRLRRLGRDIARRNQVLRARLQPWRDDTPVTDLHA